MVIFVLMNVQGDIFDNFNHKEIWEKYNLLNFYYNKNTNNKKHINIPPNRLRLKIFGGDLTIEDYRTNFSKETIYSNFPIIYCKNKEICWGIRLYSYTALGFLPTR